MMYDYAGDVLLLDGLPVLQVPDATAAEMAEVVAKYQAIADAPKQDPVLVRYRKLERLAIDEERAKVLQKTGVLFNGVRWHSDPGFQMHLIGYAVAFLTGVLPPATKVSILAMDDTSHQLTFDEIKGLSAALLGFVQTTYESSWAEKSVVGSLPLGKLPHLLRPSKQG